jgi:hypothetical protein
LHAVSRQQKAATFENPTTLDLLCITDSPV